MKKTQKKIIATIISLMIVMAVFAPTALAGPGGEIVWSIANVEAAHGVAYVDVALSITANDGVEYIMFWVYFDNTVLGPPTVQGFDHIMAGFGVPMTAINPANRANIEFMSASPMTNVNHIGTALVLRFPILPAFAVNTSTSITFLGNEANNSAFQPVSVSGTAGSVTLIGPCNCPATCEGDDCCIGTGCECAPPSCDCPANCEGDDCCTLANCECNYVPAPPTCDCPADCEGDDCCDLADCACEPGVNNINITVDEDGNVTTNLPESGYTVTDGDDDSIVITIPDVGENDTVSVNIPDGWEYEVTGPDADGNLTVVITPPEQDDDGDDNGTGQPGKPGPPAGGGGAAVPPPATVTKTPDGNVTVNRPGVGGYNVTQDNGNIVVTLPNFPGNQNANVTSPPGWTHSTQRVGGNMVITFMPIATPDVDQFFGQSHNAFLVGSPDGTIRPQANITRAEVATVLFRLLNDDFRAEVWSQTNNFTDVSSNAWFNNAISTMANAGIVVDNGGAFRPNDAVTRAEFAAMVARFFSEFEPAEISMFTDIEGNWAQDYINLIAQFGWVQGAGDGTFNPNALMTRAETSAIVNRMLDRVLTGTDGLIAGRTQWPDKTNVNAWYYLYMQEATHSTVSERLEDGTIAWTQILPHLDWTVLERANSTPRALRTDR